MKLVDYFYMGVSERELKQKIERLIVECKLEITNLGIEIMEIEDLKLLNAFIKSKAEEIKATQLYTAMIAFGITFLTLMLKLILSGNTIWGILILGFLFFVSILLSKLMKKYLERRYRKFIIFQIYWICILNKEKKIL